LSLKILNDIMEMPEDRPQSTSFVNREISSGSIKLEAVKFAYPGTDNDVLSDLTFSVKSGERIGIIGVIGSGKSTLGKLLSFLYEPAGGRLLIDGIDIRQYHPAEVRKAVAYVGQDADLFSGTLKENLLVAKSDASDEEIIEVAKKTGVDVFASRHPSGYDMPVGERGNDLSGGQKQAVVMARLLLANPSIVYLDEPTANMDLASERRLLKSLADSFERNTTLLISTHRYSLLDLVDRIIVLDNGRLVLDGPKKVVMEKLAERAK
jgi:ATP-binding cassette subfamily C protein LapB